MAPLYPERPEQDRLCSLGVSRSAAGTGQQAPERLFPLSQT